VAVARQPGDFDTPSFLTSDGDRALGANECPSRRDNQTIAFESYGLDASLIAPTCSPCAEAFTNGVNDLLAHQASRIVLGGAAFIFWTREDVGFSFRDFFDQPTPEEVRALLRTVYSGGPRSDVDSTALYATVLSGSGGRTVIREWIDETVGDAKAALAAWFEDQAMVTGGFPDTVRALYCCPIRHARKSHRPTMRALMAAKPRG